MTISDGKGKINSLLLCSKNRNWDFQPGAGLIVAGSQAPHSKYVERSVDRGQSFQSLPDLPYGPNKGHSALCVTIIDDNTVFFAGGVFSKEVSVLMTTYECL